MENNRKSGQSTMSKIADNSVLNGLGCGLIGAFFPRRNTNTKINITTKSSDTNVVKNSRRCHTSSCLKNSISSKNKVSQVVNLAYTQKLRREPTFTSSELSMTIFSHRKSKANGTLNHSSTGNVILLSHLGNLKLQGNQNSSSDKKAIQKKGKILIGNIARQTSSTVKSHQPGSSFRSSANKLDPDVLKSLGNEQYRQGKLEEALDLYNQAIAIDPRNASYYSNKAAALMSLGHVIEAVVACIEAIRLYPHIKTELCACLFGSVKTVYLLITRAEAYATVGWFEEATAFKVQIPKDCPFRVVDRILHI